MHSVSSQNLLCASNYVSEGLHMKGTKMLFQSDREGYFELAVFLETAEDKVHSGWRKREKTKKLFFKISNG